MMDNWCAPQWADFTRSPQLPSDSYFEVEHEVHEPQLNFKCVKSTLLPCKEETVKDTLDVETNFDDSLEPVKNPTKIAYFIPHDNKKQSEETNNDNVSNTAKRSMKLDEKSHKTCQAWNVSVHELTSAFKVQSAPYKAKSMTSEKMRKSIHISQMKNNILNKQSLKDNQITNEVKEKGNTQTASIKSETTINLGISHSEYTKIDFTKKRMSYRNIPGQRRMSNVFRSNRNSLGKSQPKVLTCQFRRQSLIKYRRCSNQFISLAEAVSKFQTGTPQRFRTISNKDLKPGPVMKLKRAPLKLTNPVSPALRCKQRARRITVMSKEEREALELEEMKKHQIKANPVPVNILKASAVLKKVTKKPITVPEEFRLTQPKKTRHTTGPQLNSQHTDEQEQSYKTAAPMTRCVSTSNVTSKKIDTVCTEQSTDIAKSETSALPSSFEARNKEFQMKKEEKLKTLQDQEINKIKAEFHARPVPKFSKSSNTNKEQIIKKRVVPCPFSFEERDKCLAKKKEELVKQLQEKYKKPRVFHANPAPNFKPVMVHVLSKENLRNKEKSSCNSKALAIKQTKNVTDQENKQPNIIAPTVSVTKEITQNIAHNQPDKKQPKIIVDTVEKETQKTKTNAKKLSVSNFKLHSDKRAKERIEFDEKIRKKEEELEAKRQEEEKNKVVKEKLERAELRKMTEVKARPMPVYKPLVILKSNKPPTSPKSPGRESKAKSKRVP